ncbi:hypothetical protein SprV_0602213000 [Sparganum proliferum]
MVSVAGGGKLIGTPENHVPVVEIEEGSVSERSGLISTGDRIVKINYQEIESREYVIELFAECCQNAKISLMRPRRSGSYRPMPPPSYPLLGGSLPLTKEAELRSDFRGRVSDPKMTTNAYAHLPMARVSPLTVAAWNIRSPLGNPRSNRSERRTALVARELARDKLEIAALSETCFSELGQSEVGCRIHLLEQPPKNRATRRHPERHRRTTAMSTTGRQKPSHEPTPASSQQPAHAGFNTSLHDYSPRPALRGRLHVQHRARN